MTRPLHLVAPAPPSPADLLRELVPSLQQSERTSARLKQMIAEQGRKLARERGVAFIRVEHLLSEFGKEARRG